MTGSSSSASTGDADAAFAWWGQRDVATRRIAGRVTFQGAPVAGAIVELDGLVDTVATRTTNAKGEFDFGPRVAMEWVVTASATGKTGMRMRIDSRDPHASPDKLELELGACDAALSGTIRDASGGPIAKARVRRIAMGKEVVLHGSSATSDDNGAYELCVNARWPGWVAVEVSADGYAALVFRRVVPGRITADFALVPEAVIAGRVVRDDNGEPIANAYVHAPGTDDSPGRAALTDANGRFRLERLAAGRHAVLARADGMAAGTAVVLVGVGQTSAEIEIRLEAGSTLRGRVVDGDKPISGARVAVISSALVAPDANTQAVTQADGTFVIAGVARGDVRFTAFPYEVKSPETFHVSKADHSGITIEVSARGSITGTAVRNKKPVPMASIYVSGPNDDELGDVTADANGRFAVHGLRPGPWRVDASDDSIGAFGRAPGTVIIEGNETKDVTIDIPFAASISGRVIDQTGAPVGGVGVMWRHASSDDAGITSTRSDGTYRAATMTGGGTYRAVVKRAMPSQTNLEPASGTDFPSVTLENGSSEVTGVDLVVRLDHLVIAGRVVDESGQPIPDVRVIADVSGHELGFGSGLQHPAATTDIAGRFSIEDLGAGTYALLARTPSGISATQSGVVAGRSNVIIAVPAAGVIEVTTPGFAATPTVRAIRSDAIGALAPTMATPQGSLHVLRNLTPGRYLVEARTGTEGVTATVEVAAGRTSRVTLVSTGSGAIAGVVRDFKTNKPVQGMTCYAVPQASAALFPPMGSFALPPGMTEGGSRSDAQGAFVVQAPAGEVVLRCDGLWRTYSDGLRTLTLAPSQRTDTVVPVVALDERPTLELGGLGANFDPSAITPRLVHVEPKGPAATAGFRDGDVVTSVDGASVTQLSPRGVWVLTANRAPGSKIAITATRGGATISGEVTLGEAPR